VERQSGLIIEDIKEDIWMIRRMDSECLSGEMEGNMKAIGLMGSSMAKVT